VTWKSKTSLEDTLDVFPCHGVGGAVGMIMTALLANVAVNSANTTGNGLLVDGSFDLFKVHMIALVIVVAYTFIGSFILLKITDLISPLKVTAEELKVGSDFSQHGEAVYPYDLSTAKETI
jgi:Amt family ammonium transporter